MQQTKDGIDCMLKGIKESCCIITDSDEICNRALTNKYLAIYHRRRGVDRLDGGA